MEESHEEKSNPSPLKQIRTFQGDIAEALGRQQESLVSIQQAELNRRRAEGRAFQEVPTAEEHGGQKKFLLFLGTLILFALGAGGAWYTYYEYKAQTAVPDVKTPESRFFSIDAEKKVDVTNISRLDLIKIVSEAAGDSASGETRHFLLTTRDANGIVTPLPTNGLFKILETRAPGSLIRAFGEPFMLGAFGTSTYLILELTSFENAFAGMLNWEENMAADIAPIFSTRELLRDIAPAPVFIDITDRNKDARLLMAGERTVLLYSFFDNKKLIITDNTETLRVLVERLTREKLSR